MGPRLSGRSAQCLLQVYHQVCGLPVLCAPPQPTGLCAQSRGNGPAKRWQSPAHIDAGPRPCQFEGHCDLEGEGVFSKSVRERGESYPRQTRLDPRDMTRQSGRSRAYRRDTSRQSGGSRARGRNTGRGRGTDDVHPHTCTGA